MDPHHFGKLDPDPHLSEQKDPELGQHQRDTDPRHFLKFLRYRFNYLEDLKKALYDISSSFTIKFF
jgi:hypothetical protein